MRMLWNLDYYDETHRHISITAVQLGVIYLVTTAILPCNIDRIIAKSSFHDYACSKTFSRTIHTNAVCNKRWDSARCDTDHNALNRSFQKKKEHERNGHKIWNLTIRNISHHKQLKEIHAFSASVIVSHQIRHSNNCKTIESLYVSDSFLQNAKFDYHFYIQNRI